IVPYRYLVEQAIEPDVSVGLGGPRVLAPGKTGRYGVTVNNVSNLDTPYIYFQFGIPELGKNSNLYGFDYVDFSSNLGGRPDAASLQDVPWTSLNSTLNTTGENLAPGYAFDLPTGGTVTQTFSAATYPGLEALLAATDSFSVLSDAINKLIPDAHVATP